MPSTDEDSRAESRAAFSPARSLRRLLRAKLCTTCSERPSDWIVSVAAIASCRKSASALSLRRCLFTAMRMCFEMNRTTSTIRGRIAARINVSR